MLAVMHFLWKKRITNLVMHEPAIIHLDILQLFIASLFEELQPWMIFHQNGATPHWILFVNIFLDETLQDW